MHRSPHYDHGKLSGETVVFAGGEVRVYADAPSESQNPAVDSTSVVCRGSDGTVLGELSLNMSDVPELVEFLCLAYGVDINAAERCVLAIRKHAAAICNCGLANVDNHPARAADMAILKDSRGLGCIVMFVAGATLPAGSTLKFELQFTDSGSREQAIASCMTEQATEQHRPSNIDRATSTEQDRPSKIDRARIALDLGDEQFIRGG